MVDENFKPRLRELVDLHNQFARAVKLVEQINSEIDTTSLNDARYALRAVIDCIETTLNGDTKRFDDAFTTARHALNVAWHDTVDITFTEFKLYLDALSEEFGADIVSESIDVAACKTLIHKYEDLARESRQHRKERPEIYRQITDEDLETILQLIRSAQDAEPAISAKFRKEQDRLLRESRRDTYVKAGSFIALLAFLAYCYVNIWAK